MRYKFYNSKQQKSDILYPWTSIRKPTRDSFKQNLTNFQSLAYSFASVQHPEISTFLITPFSIWISTKNSIACYTYLSHTTPFLQHSEKIGSEFHSSLRTECIREKYILSTRPNSRSRDLQLWYPILPKLIRPFNARKFITLLRTVMKLFRSEVLMDDGTSKTRYWLIPSI